MNNEQVIWWICQNNEVYLQPALADALLPLTQQHFQLTHSQAIHKILSQYCKTVGQLLQQGKTARLGNDILFFSSPVKRKQQKEQLIQPRFCLTGAFKRIVASCPSYPNQQQINNKVIKFEEICKLVGSMLFINSQAVYITISIFAKALNDLILSGKQIQLQLKFCTLALSKLKAECIFCKQLIGELNGIKSEKQERSEWMNRYRLRGQPGEEAAQRQFYGRCWEQIKEGNLFKRPSLKEIQNHLEKGYQLQLKCKQIFKDL